MSSPPDVAVDGEAAQRAPEPPATPAQKLRNMVPSEGESLWAGDLEIRGVPAMRPGLPTYFTAFQFGRLMCSGNWQKSEELALKLFGDKLPRLSVTKTVPAGLRDVRSDRAGGFGKMRHHG